MLSCPQNISQFSPLEVVVMRAQRSRDFKNLVLAASCGRSAGRAVSVCVINGTGLSGDDRWRRCH